MQQKIPQLDAVRGVAILVVLVHNLNGFSSRPLSYLTMYGWMGVDLFFVLSGFLITGILLDSKGSGSYFRNFYARRCLRIWPLYYSVLILMFLLIPLIRPHEAAEIFRRSSPWWSYPFFLQNFLVTGPSLSVGPLGVSWSLAVEELFYLVWPLFVRFLSVGRLQLLAWSVLLLSPIVRLFFLSQHWLIYTNPFCRLDGMMAGALLALLVRKAGFAPGPLLTPAWLVLFLGAPLAVATHAYNAPWLTFSMAVAVSAAFVYLAMFSASRWLKACLTNRFLMYSGTISYGLYLLHKLPHDAFKAAGLPDAYPRLVFWTTVALAYVLAIASWHLLEKPFLRLKRLFESEPREPDATRAPLTGARDSEAT